MTSLIVLHGFTQNGALLSAHLAPLIGRLPTAVTSHFPDGPHTCSEAGLKRLARMLDTERSPPPHLSWWDATDDGSVYRGFDTSRERLRALVEAAQEPFGLFGFSQGAILTASLLALAAHGEFPTPQFAIMVAGRVPRAHALQTLFDRPLTVPSLHVWGTRDPFGVNAEPLSEHFAPEKRELLRWDGPHVIPTYGPAADRILDFITRQVTG